MRVHDHSVLSIGVLCKVCNAAAAARRVEATAPLDRAGLLSRATFWWVMPTLKTAMANGRLDVEDLPELAFADDPERLHRQFAGEFCAQIMSASHCAPRPNL
jgi:hypothetical protein